MQALRQIVEQAGFPQDHGTAPHEPEAENTSPGLAKDESYKKLGEQPSEPPMTAKVLEPEVALGPEVPVVDTLPKLPQGEASSGDAPPWKALRKRKAKPSDPEANEDKKCKVDVLAMKNRLFGPVATKYSATGHSCGKVFYFND